MPISPTPAFRSSIPGRSDGRQERRPHAPNGPAARWLADRRQAAGLTRTDVVNRRAARIRRAEGRAWRHAGPAGDRRAADRLRRRDQDRALCDGRHQDLPLHPALRRGCATPTTRTARPPRSSEARPTDARSRRRCRPSAATSCRCRRSSPPSRWPASAPTTWRARARSRSWSRARRGWTGSSWNQRPDADTAVFEVQRARASICARLARDLARPAARSAMSRHCAACGSGRSPRQRRFRWTSWPCRSDTPPASPDLLLPVATALADIPALALTETEACGLSHGQAISLVDADGSHSTGGRPRWGAGRAPWRGSRFVGLCRLEAGLLVPERLVAQEGPAALAETRRGS